MTAQPGVTSNCLFSESDVHSAFLAAPPLISKNIYNLTVKTPRWVRDLYEVEEFPLGNGTEMQQLILRGQMPAIERGFDTWKKLSNNQGCTPCEGPDCSYNWKQFGGLGIERKAFGLMAKDFKSESLCVKEIQTTAHFEQIIGQFIQNLYAQIDFEKEFNIGFNYLTSLTKKYVVDSEGPKPNRENAYVYRPLGSARISALNIELLEYFYEYMRLIPDAIPYDVADGSPLFALEASAQLLAGLYRDDPQLRQDIRFSGLSNDLVTKYNFISSIRGMFISAPILTPRRFKYDSGSSEWIEVLPFENDIPMEVGSFTGLNPDYVNPAVATHEELIIHGKSPFKVFTLPTTMTLGENTSFGPEFSFLNNWQWINPMTVTDPGRRVGYFWSSATIGLAPQYSEAMFSILVERKKVGLTAAWLPEAPCPPDAVECSNTVPAVLCPCPLVTNAFTNPVTGDTIIQLAVPLSPVPSPTDEIQFGLDTGGYTTGTVVDANADGLSVEVTLDPDVASDCDHFTTVFCDNTLGCSALVQAYSLHCANGDKLDLVLSHPIKADEGGDSVVLTFGNGDTMTVEVETADMNTLTWVVDVGSEGDFCDNVGGIISICVPTATDGTCPACGGPSYTQCAT